MRDLTRRATAYLRNMQALNRNVRLLYLASVFHGTSQGIISVVFSLFVLSLGVGADVLGGILSASPLAQAVGSIPAGFLAETIGFRSSLLLIYGVSGLAQLAQYATSSVPLIGMAAFVTGLALSGDFVVRLPFLAANSEPSQRATVFSVSSLLFSLSVSLGALIAGYLPTALLRVVPDLTEAYRYTLYIAGALDMLAVLPCLGTRDLMQKERRKISFRPYLWGMDRFTLQQAIVSLFVGLSAGTIMSFASVLFVYKLGTAREFFGTVAALSIIPVTLGAVAAPKVAQRLGSVPAVTWLRLAIPASLATLAWTSSSIVGMGAYWAQRVLFMMSQPLSFAFAMDAAGQKSKAPVSAWLNVTFWLGNAIAAPVAGAFVAQNNYALPLLMSGAAAVLAAICNQVFFGPVEARMKQEVDLGR